MTYQRRGKSVSVVQWASFSLAAGLIMGFAGGVEAQGDNYLPGHFVWWN